MDAIAIGRQAIAMLQCEPRSVFTWTYDVHGAAEGAAEVIFRVWTEQGHITLGGVQYDVLKLGPGSGQWNLTRGGDIVASAYKATMFRRSFEVSAASGELLVQASSAFRRAFDIVRGGEIIGRIEPTSAFRRRATIDCDASVSTVDQLFAFWLAVQMWRRAARNND